MKKTIELQCQCGKLLRAPRWRTGQRGRCVHCHKTVTIPAVYGISAIPEVKPKSEVISCPACGRENPVGEYCTHCNTPLLQSKPVEKEMPAATSKRSFSKIALVFLIILALPMAAGIYHYRLKIIPVLNKWVGKTEQAAAEESSAQPRGTPQTSQDEILQEAKLHEEYRQWRQKWQEFAEGSASSDEDFPILIRKRDFSQAGEKIANFQESGAKFSKYASAAMSEIAEKLEDVREIEALFDHFYPTLEKHKKNKKPLSVNLIIGKKKGSVEDISKEDRYFILSGDKRKIPFSYLEVSELEEIIQDEHKKESVQENQGKDLYYLGMLFFYEGKRTDSEKYLKKAAELYEPAKAKLESLKADK